MMQMLNLQGCHVTVCMQAVPVEKQPVVYFWCSSLEESPLPMKCSPNGKGHPVFSPAPSLTWLYGAQELSMLHSHSKCTCFVH